MMPRAVRRRRASRPPLATRRVVRPLRFSSAIPIDFMAAKASVLLGSGSAVAPPGLGIIPPKVS